MCVSEVVLWFLLGNLVLCEWIVVISLVGVIL